jgi:hypothetical protein
MISGKEEYYPWLIEKLHKHRTNPKTERTGLQLHDGWEHLMNTIGLDQLDDFVNALENIVENFWDWRTGNLKTLNEKAVWIKNALEYELEEHWCYSGSEDVMEYSEGMKEKMK